MIPSYVRASPLLWAAAALTLALAAAVLLQLPFANGPAEWEWAYRPPGFGDWSFARAAGSLASRHSFGYLYDAALALPARVLLADFPAATRHLNQHARTHPPGALLGVRAMDALGRVVEQKMPGREEAALVATARSALEREAQRARDRRRPAPTVLPSPWTVVGLAFLLPALSAAAALPLYALARTLGLSARAALVAAVLWLLVPARSLFTPSLDQALPFLLVPAAWLAAGAGRARWAAAGAVLAAACFTSYGYLAAIPLVAAVALAGGAGEAAWRRRAVAWLAAGFVLPWLVLAVFAGYDPWAAFASAMAAHREIAVAGRGYLTWLLWNPYDFALLLGPPVALLALAAFFLRPRLARPLATPLAVWWGTLALLWLAGAVRGEVGRIWLLFMPFACLFAAAAIERRGELRPVPLLAVVVPQAALLAVLAASMVFVR